MHTSESFSSSPAPEIAFIGGGSGTSNLVAGFAKTWPEARLTAIVAMADSGGSTGEIRDQFDTVAVGDLRKVTSALAGDARLAALFEHRFGQQDDASSVEHVARMFYDGLAAHGLPQISRQADTSAFHMLGRSVELASALKNGVRGHTFGNLVMTALIECGESVTEAAATAGDWLRTRGRVLPVSEVSHDLILQDGSVTIVGEHAADEYVVQHPRDAAVTLRARHAGESVTVAPAAAAALERADITLICPGSIFTSTLPVIATEGLSNAIARGQERGGTLMAIGNLVSGPDAHGMHVSQIFRKVQASLGADRKFAHVLYNTDMAALPAGQALEFDPSCYNDNDWDAAHGHPLVRREQVYINPNDAIAHLRSNVHHDAEVVADIVRNIWKVQPETAHTTPLPSV